MFIMIDKTNLRKTWGGVFDGSTIMSLSKLMDRGVIKELVKPINEGKESIVLAGRGNGNIAVKVYAVRATNFKKMMPYIFGDPRFEKVRKNQRSIIFAWCKKEFKNLQRALKAGVNCPKPIAFLNNILVMEFVGEKEAAPRLSDYNISASGNEGKKRAHIFFKHVVKDMRLLYKKARMVHGDLSEYNILISDKPVLIDFSQAVLLEHPNADEFLRRDVRNVCNFFRKHGVKAEEEKVYGKIVK